MSPNMTVKFCTENPPAEEGEETGGPPHCPPLDPTVTALTYKQHRLYRGDCSKLASSLNSESGEVVPGPSWKQLGGMMG